MKKLIYIILCCFGVIAFSNAKTTENIKDFEALVEKTYIMSIMNKSWDLSQLNYKNIDNFEVILDLTKNQTYEEQFHYPLKFISNKTISLANESITLGMSLPSFLVKNCPKQNFNILYNANQDTEILYLFEDDKDIKKYHKDFKYKCIFKNFNGIYVLTSVSAILNIEVTISALLKSFNDKYGPFEKVLDNSNTCIYKQENTTIQIFKSSSQQDYAKSVNITNSKLDTFYKVITYHRAIELKELKEQEKLETLKKAEIEKSKKEQEVLNQI